MKKRVICFLLSCSFSLTGCNKSKTSKSFVETTEEDFIESLNEAVSKRPKYNTVKIRYSSVLGGYRNIFDWFARFSKYYTVEFKITEDVSLKSLENEEHGLYEDLGEHMAIYNAIYLSQIFENENSDTAPFIDWLHDKTFSFKYYKSPGFKVVRTLPSSRYSPLPITSEYIWDSNGYLEYTAEGDASYTWFNS